MCVCVCSVTISHKMLVTVLVTEWFIYFNIPTLMSANRM